MTADQHRKILHGALAVSTLVLVYLFSAFATVLLADVILALVTWPLYRWFREKLHNDYVAAGLATLVVSTAVLLPLGAAAWFGAREAVGAGEELVGFVTSGGLKGLLADLESQLAGPWVSGPWVEGEMLADRIGAGLEQSVGAGVQTVGLWVTGGFALALGMLLQVGIGILVLASLYLEGPSLLQQIRRFGPLDSAHLDRLFTVFDQLAHNMAYGVVATSIAQGLVAAVGFWLAGAERVALLGIGTAIASQVPIVGSAVVWGPLAIAFALEGAWWRAAFVAGWSLLLTASVDNVIKPLIYRQGLGVHPVLFLLAMLGGLATWGPTGLLVGPLVLVLFLTLYTLYSETPGTTS
jgi:predicted PurR-regulated permease PerM